MWRIRVAQQALRFSEHWQCLAASEREQALSYHHDADRDRFVVARATLRQLLCRRLDLDPTQVAFVVNEFGKPRLAPPHSLHFNTSHAGDWVLHAFSTSSAVGVDVEPIPTDALPIEDYDDVLAPQELRELLSLSTAQRGRAFTTLWVCKEAYVKAWGQGLNRSLREICIGPCVDGKVGVLHDSNPGGVASEWQLAMLDVGPDHAACVACSAPAPPLRIFDFQ